MIGNFIRQKMAGYLRQAEVYGSMRRMWMESAFWTREAVCLPTKSESLERALTVPQVISGFFGDYYSDATVKQIEIALTGHMRAVINSAEDLKAHGERIIRVMTNANSHLNEGELRDHVEKFTRLSASWVASHKGGQTKAGIAAFDTLVDAATGLADYLSTNLIAQFNERFK